MEIDIYKTFFLEHLNRKIKLKEPANLYEPINYILNLDGKRLRPVLTLISCELLGGDMSKALDAALAIEMFHNFSLVHDDIMDDAPIRRGKKTVHEKWNINTGILSGDAMLVMSNQLLESYDGPQYKKLNSLFNKTALEVCEGQQFDMDFEVRTDVTVDEYIRMITLKTAVLLATSLKFGAIIASADENDILNIYNYGLNLGIAFQLQDDYLDIFGDEAFGKQNAGDIVENKKTYFYVKTLEEALESDKINLLKLYEKNKAQSDKINKVVELYVKYGIPNKLKAEIKKYTAKANENISELSIPADKKEILIRFSKQLMQRLV